MGQPPPLNRKKNADPTLNRKKGQPSFDTSTSIDGLLEKSCDCGHFEHKNGIVGPF